MRRVTLLVRQAGAERAVLVATAVLVLVLAFLAAAAPREAARRADDALRHALGSAPPAARTLSVGGDFTSGGAGAGGGVEVLEGMRRGVGESLGPALRPLVSGGTYSSTTPDLTVADRSGRELDPARFLALRLASEWAPRVRFAAGRAPGGSGYLTYRVPDAPPGGEQVQLTLVEAALSSPTATRLGVRPGGQFVLASGGASVLAVRVTGVFEALDPGEEYWATQPRVLHPDEVTGPQREPRVLGTALVGEDSYAPLTGVLGTLQVRNQVDFSLDTARIAAGDVPGVEADLARLAAGAGGLSGHPDLQGIGRLEVVSGLPFLLQRHLGQRRAATALTAVQVAGVLALGLALLGLLATLAAQRRQAAIRLLRTRGASARQVVALLAAEQALVAVPAAAAGGLLALALLPARPLGVPLLLAGLVAVGAVAASTSAAAAQVRPGAGGAVTRRGPGTAAGWRARATRAGARSVVEGLVLLLAAAAVLALRRRGLAPAADAGLDPLTTLAPVLASVAAGLLVVRLYPRPLRLAAGAARRGRGLVGFLGLAGAARGATGGGVPLLVVLLAVGYAVSSGVLAATLDRGRVRASWDAVGADARVEGPAFAPGAARAFAAVPGVRSVASAHVVPGAEVDTTGTGGAGRPAAQLTAYAVSAAELAPLLERGLVEDPLPAAFADPVAPGGPVPAVVTPGLATRAAGGLLPLDLDGATLTVRVVGTREGFPGVRAGVPTAVVQLEGARTATDRPLRPTSLLLEASGVRAGDLRAAADAAAPGLAVTAREDVLDGLRGSPLVVGVSRAFTLGAAAGALACAAAVVLTLVVTARARGLVLSYLRTLGLSRREARRLVAAELAPSLAAAVLGGVAVGLVVPRLVAPGLDLRPFTGGAAQPPVAMDAAGTALVVALVLALAALAAAVTAAVTRRSRPGAALRIGAGE